MLHLPIISNIYIIYFSSFSYPKFIANKLVIITLKLRMPFACITFQFPISSYHYFMVAIAFATNIRQNFLLPPWWPLWSLKVSHQPPPYIKATTNNQVSSFS